MKINTGTFILLTMLTIAGCTKKTPEELLVEAKQSLEQKDVGAAVVSLKNVIKAEPANAEARFLLGKLYLEQGAANAAEKELKLAQKNEYEKDKVIPLLAKAYNLQFKFDEAIELAESAGRLNANSQTAVLLYRALAYFNTDRPTLAKQSIQEANEISADSLYSRLGNAYLGFNDQRVSDTVEQVDAIITLDNTIAEAYLLKAQLLTIQGDDAGAVENFEKYHELLPNLMIGRILLANAYVKNQQFEDAEEHLDLLLKVNESQPFINQLKGVVRYRAGDFANAKRHTEIAIQNGLDNVPNRIIAGISSMQQESYEQSFQHLDTAVRDLPDDHPVRRLHTVVALQLGYSVDASNSLNQLETMTEEDIVLLSAASAQLLREGNRIQAQDLAKRAGEINFSDPIKMAQRGMLRLSLNDLEGITDLEDALSLSPDSDETNTILARAYIDNQLYDQALALSKEWISDNPDRVNGYVLEAIAYLGLDQTNMAESSYQKALGIDKGNPAANMYFADKEIAENRLDGAIPFLTALIETYPNYTAGLGKYFVVQNSLGDPDRGLSAIENALAQNRESEPLTLLYGVALYNAKRYSKTIEALTNMSVTDDYPISYWTTLGNAYIQSGQIDKAEELAEKWIDTEPSNEFAYYRKISINELSKNFELAIETAKLGQLRFTDESQFTVLVTHFSVLLGDIGTAKRNYDLLPISIKQSIIGQGLEGQILLESGKPEEALPNLVKFYEANKVEQNATFVGKALKNLGRYDDGVSFLKSYLENAKISSPPTLLRIAELLILDKKYDEAISQYMEVLELDNANLRALNNVSYLLNQQGKTRESLSYAKKAMELYPHNPSLLDTYATTLYKSGNVSESVEFFAKSFDANPANVDVGIRYARALIETNNSERAQQVLDSLKKMSRPQKEQVEHLKERI